MPEYAFDRRVDAYAVSLCHQSGPSLQHTIELAAVSPGDLALDIATGTGFTALALAERGARVDALDISLPMLRHTSSSAPDPPRALRGVADRLPVRDAAYDLVACRHALHHFADPGIAIREMARVARPGGRVVIADTVSPDDDSLAFEMHEIEVLRDQSHVRNLATAKLADFLSEAGLAIAGQRTCRSPQNFDRWVARTGGGPNLADHLWARLSAQVMADAFETRFEDGVRHFSWPVRVVAAVRR